MNQRSPTLFRKLKISTVLTGIAIAGAVCLGSAQVGSAQLTFNLNDVTPGGMPAAALAGFQQAAAVWEATVDDPITVNVDIRFDGNDLSGNPLGGSTLGSTGATTEGLSYTNVRAALLLDLTSTLDLTATANLPAAPALSFLINDPNTGAVITDNDGSANNTILDINTANAKAIGLRLANDPATDAGVALNSAFSWDFDQTDGVGAGLQDFVGVTVHEFGHTLGFVSGVDTVDATHLPNGPAAPIDLDPFRVHSVLDLYRYSGTGQLNYATGGAPYFSIDGGATNLAPFSTGSFNGDGNQASHWKDNLGLGLLDPTANPPGNVNVLSQLDLVAFDVIGYNLRSIPEPSSAMLMLLTGAGLGLLRRR